MATEHRDIIIVGAGISGIGAAVHLTKACPGKTYMVLEGRSAMGGTWDLFRYPGIRSDSDMYTFDYSFKPWREGKAIADGQSILRYLHETAAEYGVDAHIRYRHTVTRTSWSSEDSTWTVEATRGDTGESVRYTCSFLVMCSGYYRYKRGYEPHFEGREQFRGPIVHPQQWPEGLDYRGKRVVVIGSGATAVALGDQRWRALLSTFHRLVRTENEAHRGSLIDTAGDGVFASFDGTVKSGPTGGAK